MSKKLSESLRNAHEKLGEAMWDSPQDLYAFLVHDGSDAMDARSLQLLLESGPVFAQAMHKKELSTEEISMLIDLLSRNSRLKPSETRRIVSQSINALGLSKGSAHKTEAVVDRMAEAIVGVRGENPTTSDRQVFVSAMSAGEDTDYIKANMILRSNGDTQAALVDLKNLSTAGNMQAAYDLGRYYYQRAVSQPDLINAAETQFIRSADLGFGPANGGVMACEMRRADGSIERAAEYMERAGSLFGTYGREWVQSTRILHAFIDNNRKERIALSVLSVLALAVALVTAIFVNVAVGVIATIIGILILGYATIISGKKPYVHDLIWVCGLLVQWIFLGIAIL